MGPSARALVVLTGLNQKLIQAALVLTAKFKFRFSYRP